MGEGLKKTIVFIIAIVMLSVMFISAGGRERITVFENIIGSVVTPVQKGFSSVGYFIDSKVEPVKNVWNYSELNKELIVENQMLKEQITSLTLEQKQLTELEELESQLNYLDGNSIENYLTGDVIAKDVGNWYNMFVISLGSDDGVTKNSTVINGDGLIGMVYETGSDWSKVVSIIDTRSTVSFEMLDYKNDFDGTVTGTLDYELVGEFFDPMALCEEGDFVVTSGYGMYAEGIIIGKIYNVIEDKNELLTKIEIEPTVNFKNINKVIVIPYEGEYFE